MIDSFFEYDGINFHYQDDDNGEEPFIFLHGLGGSVEQTMSVVQEDPKIRRISFDFRGHGKTVEFGSKDKISFKQWKEDTLALMNHLNLEKANIGGISTGAGVALNLVLSHPDKVKKLVLSRPAWEDEKQEEDIRRSFSEISRILNDESIEDKKEAYQSTAIYKKMDSISKYASNTLLGQFDYPFAAYTSDKLIRIPQDAPSVDRNKWKDISKETLIVVSKFDPIHPYDYGKTYKSHIKNSKLVEIISKEISSPQHNEESHKVITDFLNQ